MYLTATDTEIRKSATHNKIVRVGKITKKLLVKNKSFHLVFLSVSQCQGIAPCYTTLELKDFLEISLT